jgi:hypothetical protein
LGETAASFQNSRFAPSPLGNTDIRFEESDEIRTSWTLKRHYPLPLRERVDRATRDQVRANGAPLTRRKLIYEQISALPL